MSATNADAGHDRPPSLSFTALVCAYTLDRWTEIGAAITSLRTQSHPPHEVLLVVDHNLELLQRARAAFPGIRVLPNEGKQGLSGARNTGVRAATGDVVGFLDDDAAADTGWVESMLQAYLAPGVLGVGGWVRPAWQVPRPSWFPEEFLWVVGCSYRGLPLTTSSVRNPIGANMSFRRDVLVGIGGFETDIGRLGADAAGCEETELSIRAAERHPGGRILLEPSAVVEHAVTGDRATRRYFRRRCAAEGRSKALVSTLAGEDAALSTERAYVRRTLPAGIGRGLRDAVTGDVSGLARAWSIIEGTVLTAANYLVARRRLARERPLNRRPATSGDAS